MNDFNETTNEPYNIRIEVFVWQRWWFYLVFCIIVSHYGSYILIHEYGYLKHRWNLNYSRFFFSTENTHTQTETDRDRHIMWMRMCFSVLFCTTNFICILLTSSSGEKTALFVRLFASVCGCIFICTRSTFKQNATQNQQKRISKQHTIVWIEHIVHITLHTYNIWNDIQYL